MDNASLAELDALREEVAALDGVILDVRALHDAREAVHRLQARRHEEVRGIRHRERRGAGAGLRVNNLCARVLHA